jgi:hypothetical protein
MLTYRSGGSRVSAYFIVLAPEKCRDNGNQMTDRVGWLLLSAIKYPEKKNPSKLMSAYYLIRAHCENHRALMAVFKVILVSCS